VVVKQFGMKWHYLTVTILGRGYCQVIATNFYSAGLKEYHGWN